jgi:hypothetical protein
MSVKIDYYDNPESDEDFIQIAIDYLGTAIRDNSRSEKISIGKKIHLGEWDEDN